MKTVLAFILIILASTAWGQTRLFDVNKLDSINFKKFIADKKIIVVGEMHGTTEVPLFVLQLVRQLQKDQNKLTVGLEIPINHQGDIDEFMKTGDFNKLLKLDYFKYPDGRTSVAMGQLTKGLRDIKGLRVICFDIDTSLGPVVNRDSLMGVNLSKSYTSGQMVLLTGNLHANLKDGYWRPNFKSAIFHFNRIKKFDDKLVSLNTYFGSGTIWNCMQDGCKEREAGSNSSLKQKYGLTNFIGIYEGVHPSGYSGFVYFDTVTASKPLVN
jgi:hypothetical protein